MDYQEANVYRLCLSVSGRGNGLPGGQCLSVNGRGNGLPGGQCLSVNGRGNGLPGGQMFISKWKR